MANLRYLALIVLGLILGSGCDNSETKPQSWEGKKPQASDKSTVAQGETGKDAAGTTENPHGMADPHGMMNPHGAGAGAGAPAAMIENNGKLDVDTLHWTAPKTWVRKQPRSEFIKAEYGLPKVEGDAADGRLTVSMANGGVDANIERWKSQFEKLDKENKETMDVAGVKVTLIDFSGTYADGGMMGPKTSRPDYRMVGAVYDVGDTLLFVKAYGPAKTMEAQATPIKDFVKSYKVDK